MKDYLTRIYTFYDAFIRSYFRKTTHYLDEHKNLAYGALVFDVIIAFFSIPLALYFKIGDEFFTIRGYIFLK